MMIAISAWAPSRSALFGAFRCSVQKSSHALAITTRRSLHATAAHLQNGSSAPQAKVHVPRIDAERLMRELHHTCQWGAAHPFQVPLSSASEVKGDATADPQSKDDPATWTGMRRLTLSDSDKTVRDWFVRTCRDELGCQVSWDDMGNIYAVRPDRHGRLSDAYRASSESGAEAVPPPTALGSHFDTQPSAGRYDGILGMHAAIEAFRTMDAHAVKTAYPTAIVNWTNEEGARFPKSVLSSGVWAGLIDKQVAWDLKEVDSLKEEGSGEAKTFKAELQRIGYLNEAIPCSHESRPLAAHFELHIEQGPRLKSEGKRIGVVQGGQAYLWATMKITGKAAHTGSTPWANRADSLQAASKIIGESTQQPHI